MLHKVLRKQESSNDCFVCGINNESGIKANFYEVEGEEVVCIAYMQYNHQSYPGRVHGGISAALLDETIGRAINIYERETFGVTINLDLKYRKPVPLDQEIKVIGRITKKNKRAFEGSGEIIDKDGNVLVDATATYAKVPVEKIVETLDKSEISKISFVNKEDSDPKEIEY